MYPTLDYKVIPIRSSAILTGSYVAGTAIGTAPNQQDIPYKNNELLLLISLTIGSLTTADIIVEFSTDATDWYQESYEQVPTAGVSAVVPYTRSFAATGNYRIAIPIKDRYIRVSSKGTGTATGSLLAIQAVLGSA